jgi:WD40 repeat protein
MRIIQSRNPRPLNLLAVGPNGLVAAASGAFGLRNDVEVWDAGTGTLRFAYATPHREPRSVALTPDGKYLLVAPSDRVAFIDLTTREEHRPRKEGFDFPDTALSADGRRLLVATRRGEGGLLECWELGAGPSARTLWSDGPYGEYFRFAAVALTTDGGSAAVAEQTHDRSGRPAHNITVRDGGTGTRRATIPLDSASPVQQLAFTADGSKLVVRTDSRTVQMFDAATGAPAGELVHPGRPYVTAVAVHPRGPIACARTNGTVTFWDAQTREQIRTLDWQAGRLVSVAFAPDGALAAAGTEDGKVVVWDVDL